MENRVYTVEIVDGSFDVAEIPRHFTKALRCPFRFMSNDDPWTFFIWEEDGELLGTTLVSEDTFQPSIGEEAVLIPETYKCRIKITGIYKS